MIMQHPTHLQIHNSINKYHVSSQQLTVSGKTDDPILENNETVKSLKLNHGDMLYLKLSNTNRKRQYSSNQSSQSNNNKNNCNMNANTNDSVEQVGAEPPKKRQKRSKVEKCKTKAKEKKKEKEKSCQIFDSYRDTPQEVANDYINYANANPDSNSNDSGNKNKNKNKNKNENENENETKREDDDTAQLRVDAVTFAADLIDICENLLESNFTRYANNVRMLCNM